MEEEPINQNYLIGCDTIEHSPSSVSLLIFMLQYIQIQNNYKHGKINIKGS